MKRIIILTAFLTLILPAIKDAEAIKKKSGILLKDETWSGEIRVTDVVIVPEGGVLTIKPGTTIEIVKGSIVVNGKLLAKGTKAERIIFTSKKMERDVGMIIQFGDTSDSSSVVKYATITNADTGISCIGASPTISHNLIQKNNTGIFTTSGRTKLASPRIIHNTIIQNERGIACSSQEAIIRNNIISENRRCGIISYGLPSPIIEGNILSHNLIGIECNASSPRIAHNTIYDSAEGIWTYYAPSTPVITSNIIAVFKLWGIRESHGAKPITRYNDIYSPTRVLPLNRELYAVGPRRLFNIKDVNELRKGNRKNISEEPKFIDAENGNFSLAADSPCRGKGEDKRDIGATGGEKMAVEMQKKLKTTWGKMKYEGSSFRRRANRP